MCGIIGYIGEKEANDILISGLEKLEYRGYDSAGVAVISNHKINIHKKKGRVETLKEQKPVGNFGLGHNRWATHGIPSDRNAHPFTDQSQQFAVVHNGIIANYLQLKEEPRNEGVQFSSDTDSEVIVHLVAKNYQETVDLQEAVLKTIKRLQGAYAFCIIKADSQEI